MLKRTGKMLAIAAVALATTAGSALADDCHDDNRAAGTVLGAVAGGLIGGAVSHGNGGAVVGGVILGGLAGNAIAGDVDCDDRPYAYRSYHEAFYGPVGERYEWHHGRHYGYIVTHREYWRHRRMCRDFTVVTYRHGREYDREGTACRRRDGDWEFM